MKHILLSCFLICISIISNGQILTFEFSALAGGEISASSNANDPNIASSTLTRGAGLTASNNGGRFNATNWALSSIANAISGDNYMEFTISPNPGCQFSISSIVIQMQRSSTGPRGIALRSSADGFATNLDTEYAIPDVTTTQTYTFTFSQTAVVATTYRIYMFAEATGGSGGIGDGTGNDIIVNGTTSCGAVNTITTGSVSAPPFSVSCSAPSTATGAVDFTSSGTFNAGNNYIVELSHASGSFANPIIIGTFASIDTVGSIPITIPASSLSGAGYQIQIRSDNPATLGTSSSSFEIIQTEPCLPALPSSSGLIINEWSNGPTGSQEYYEFVVAGQCGTSVDIRGFILDDNNGTFSNPINYPAGTGIAQGHFRFTNDAQWASIPVGSLIVVYNAEDPNPALPADDPSDLNNDSLYVIPHNSVFFERCTSLPNSSTPDSLYTPCTYSISPLNGWGPLSLANSGDAIQVRNPDGSYYHGVSYGGSEITGGPHNLKLFTGSGGAKCGWFNDGDFFDITNWSSGNTAGNETPGIPNNALNAAWLKLMRDPLGINCPIVVLPVELLEFSGFSHETGNVLQWSTASEYHSAYFTLEKSIDGKTWKKIHTETSAGNSTSLQRYSFVDVRFESVINYYRLSQTDVDGATTLYHKFVAIDNRENNLNPRVKIINLLGQEISETAKGVQIHIFQDGTSKRYFQP